MAKKKAEPGFESLLEKARRFCLYRERSRYETEKKIKSWGIPYSLVQKLMSSLEEEKFINDSRFAEVYARSKFRSNKWGKVKISAYLREMRISQSDIKQALLQIPQDLYEIQAVELAHKKRDTLKETDDAHTQKAKLMNYLLQKGYEMDIVQKALKQSRQ